jgi:hypothetical protein
MALSELPGHNIHNMTAPLTLNKHNFNNTQRQPGMNTSGSGGSGI